MYLTPDDILKYGPCYVAYSFMTRYYPEGGELSDIMRHKYMTEHFLHWGYENLDVSDEEKALYRELLSINCENPETIFKSRDIDCSAFVKESKHVYNSECVDDSTEVSDSKNIASSNDVHDSEKVLSSNFVFDSKEIITGTNITNSSNVVLSQFVVDSNSIYRSKQVESSQWLQDCENVEDCFMCSGCHDLKHALLCQDATGEYMIFNKPVEPKRFELIKKQMFSLLRGFEMKLNDGWKLDMFETHARISHNLMKHYDGVSDRFWSWAKTLPG
jgi:hypothetical protein